MLVLRPIAETDLAILLRFAAAAGVGVTSLPVDETRLAQRITASQRAFAGNSPLAEADYLFVLEDQSRQQVLGISAIRGAVGLDAPCYHYRIGTMVHASPALGIWSQHQSLFLSNDYTGCAELCSLYLDPSVRGQGFGALLSRARFLFIAQFIDRFPSRVISELRGVCDSQGRSPFWEGLGRHFFQIEFAEADRLTGLGHKAFVAEMMPKYPVYLDFLPAEAQAVLAQTHPDTVLAEALLRDEGFVQQGYVDIFDGGPTLVAATEHIRTIAASRCYQLRVVEQLAATATPYLLSNTVDQQFRAVLASAVCYHERQEIELTSGVAAALLRQVGDTVRACPVPVR